MITVPERGGDDHHVEVPIRLSMAEITRLLKIAERARRSGFLADDDASDSVPEQLAAFATFMIGNRRRRDLAFASIEFGEPTWDMLLDLYVGHVEGRSVSVSNLCTAAAVPATTALRWIDVMVCGGHFVRQPDPFDRRRVHIQLAPDVIARIENYLGETRRRTLAALQ